MKKFFLTFFILAFLIIISRPASGVLAAAPLYWQVQSVDTMKFSRDVARQYLDDSSFDATIDAQVKAIADTGATHVAVATPYDPEFIPFLSRWVRAARNHHLLVWFRGNLSGWENWFGYPDISALDHTQKILEFIKSNPNLFANGDIFSSCPECENGVLGDPRHTNKVAEYRQFLVSEHSAVAKIFQSLNKQVITNYYSMNADVARLVMDKNTTASLGGVVTIDHYVATPERLVSDIKDLSESSGGLIILGEYGVPIPDIHGNLDDQGQADWINKSLRLLVNTPQLIGLNYWTSFGGTTELWNSPDLPKPAVATLKSYYSPQPVQLQIKNTADKPIMANINYLGRGYSTDKKGQITLPWPGTASAVLIQSPHYFNKSITLSSTDQTLFLDPEQKNWWYNLQVLTYRFRQLIMHNIK